MKIFIIEDDLAIGRPLLSILKDEGHSAVWVRLASNAIDKIREGDFDAVLLDLGLPDGDGTALLREIRDSGLRIPVLIMTARESLEDRLNGFNLGADDYLIKPFEIPELLVRLRAIVRRTNFLIYGAESIWTVGDIVLDEGRMLVTRAGKPVKLSKTEFALLLSLFKQPDRVLTRTELESRVLPHSEGQTLDVHIFNLRKKIGEGVIRNVRGIGYMLQRNHA